MLHFSGHFRLRESFGTVETIFQDLNVRSNIWIKKTRQDAHFTVIGASRWQTKEMRILAPKGFLLPHLLLELWLPVLDFSVGLISGKSKFYLLFFSLKRIKFCCSNYLRGSTAQDEMKLFREFFTEAKVMNVVLFFHNI